MSYDLLTDENVEPASVEYLRKLGHDVEHVVDVPELGQGADDAAVAAYARRTNRLLLTQDDDFLSDFDPERDTASVLVQDDEELSAREVGDAVATICERLPRDHITVEFVSANWL